VSRSSGPETFPDLTYTIQMRRRPLFYIFSMILPCFLITIVAFLGFCVPSDSGSNDLSSILNHIHYACLCSGEKVSIGVTTLLSMTVFLMMVADSMPPNSDSLPLIGQNIWPTSAHDPFLSF
jgi:nicotinic acetylcholine receptor, invertebrate